ncbi:methyltransferase domain-containing protein [Gordonia sp. zg691]|uniref:Methyltransferase domain-containing protein n=1 Tax=Gordonia jinghuaiqii TaxID=2758710 RepID=A0A7D7LZA3_9ACTN|nr:class I SAM-dependent methyltransferase [Gordonia jinghuaiqii]MBD0861295.1 methyltransferase domain-containing protein [Gordonia jinghuaiqii]MCR5976202.1 methyltransferase domain-containing protein [Gordonia jinghuaiqii]QMT03439.1 methyltransferase domain-containing protein [Gordonia jinghuaiqii]
MTTTHEATEAAAIDPDRLMQFVFRAVDEVGATLNAALVVLGDKLGYYRDLAAHGATTPAALAERTGTAEPYAREWLNAQAAGGFVTYDPGNGTYTLPPEHAVALTDENSPAFLPGFFQIALGTVHDTAHVIEAARSGAGYGWHEHDSDVHIGCERFFRPSYHAHLISEWLPALDGVVDRLTEGTTVADVGCGHGASTILMAQSFPASTFVGSDYHPESVAIARERAAAAGVADRVSFEVAPADGFSGTGHGLVTMFDCLHDMGDPVGAAEHVRRALDPDGTWMVVEPIAGDHVEDNLHAVGRAYYGFSTLLCTPASLSQDVGLALGTQAGPSKIRAVTTSAGFTRFDRVAQTPFHQVFEVRS